MKSVGEPTADHCTNPESEHKYGNNGADGVKIDAEPAEERSLPRNLVK